MSHARHDNSACPHFPSLSPDPYFYFVFLFMEGNSAIFHKILILFGSNIEKANMECHMH